MSKPRTFVSSSSPSSSRRSQAMGKPADALKSVAAAAAAAAVDAAAESKDLLLRTSADAAMDRRLLRSAQC